LVFVTVATKAPCQVYEPSLEALPLAGSGVIAMVTVAVPLVVVVALVDVGVELVGVSSPQALVKRTRAGNAQTRRFRDEIMRFFINSVEDRTLLLALRS
jgi:hypothetical protein